MTAQRTVWMGVLLWAWLACGSAWGEVSLLGGNLDGAEATTAPLAESDCQDTALGYQATAFTVSADGPYYFVNAYWWLKDLGAPSIDPFLYLDRFDPARPELNLIASGADSPWSAHRIELQTDRRYVLVVQHACTVREGHWAVLFRGPGTLHSSRRVSLETFTSGRISNTDPVANLQPCYGELKSRYYKLIGPIRVSRSGTYYYADAFGADLLGPVCLSVYHSRFEPARPELNLEASLAFSGSLELRAGEDYFFVLTRYSDDQNWGEYQFLLVPPAPFRINAGMADAWYNPGTPGQGLMLDVLDRQNSLFLGWLTYRPDSMPGLAAPQGWLTAFGPFTGARAELELQWTSGPAPDPTAPPPVEGVGRMNLEFFDCRSGRVTYSLDNSGRQGSFALRRLREDTVALCEAEFAGPGLPGAL